MTNDKKAPLMVWLWPASQKPLSSKDRKHAKWEEGRWTPYDTSGTHTGQSGKVKYIRHDLHLALVGAAYNGVSAWLEKLYDPPLDGDEATMIVGQALLSAADLTRDLTPDDAQADLDRMLREEREKALREAAEECERVRMQKANGPMPEGACFDYEQRILALIEKDTP